MVWNYLAEIASALYLLVILIYSRRYNLFPSNRNRYFVRMIGMVFVTVILSITTVFSTEMYHYIPDSINLFIHTVFFLVYPWISVLFFYYTLHVIYEDRENILTKLQWTTFPIIVIYSIMVILNLQFGFMFTIDQTNGYIAYPFESLIFVVAYCYMILMLVIIERNRSYIDTALRIILISYVLITSFFVTIQYFFPHFLLVGTAAGLSILIMYLYIQSKELVADYLTHLPNRVAFEANIRIRLKSKRKLNTIVISLRDFKNVNNMYGQKNGDIILKELTSYFIVLVGRVNVFRYSGDRFAILYYENQYNTEDLIVMIYHRFKSAWLINDATIYLEANLIHVNISEHVFDQFEALALIDYLNDASKRSKRDATIFSTTESIQLVKRKAILNEYLKKALSDELFDIAIQPILNIERNEFKHAEVLLRLKHPTLGAISPAELIPLAEESGLIIELGLWVLKRSLQFLAQCEENQITLTHLSLNFSVVQMNDANLIQDVKKILDQYPQFASKIIIEITESIFIADYQRIIHQMQALNDLGIKFYLDDFGTGYSNVLNVIKLPLSVIKIDKSLVYESMTNLSNNRLIHGLCDAFKESGLKVLAEGIENEEQFNIVKQMPIDYMQGYLLSVPLPPNDALNFFMNQ